jgi:selenocysteine lyase/cysteine desulfurase
MTPSDGLQELTLDPDVTHLNHAGVGPWPRRAVEAAQRFAAENGRRGSLDYAGWLAVEQRLRERFARLLGAAGGEDVALLKNTSEGLSFVAAGLDWQPGDNVVFPYQEFPSNRLPWEALAARGVEPRAVDMGADPDPEALLLEACDARTRVLAVSAVQYADGLRMDLSRLGDFCRSRETLLCVDAIQQLGVLPFDVAALGADFAMADGHKWLLGPEGVAAFWVRPEIRERLALVEYGWHMVEASGDYDRHDWQPAASARRFEAGSPNLLGAHAMEASLSLLEDVGMEEVARAVLERTSHIIERVEASPALERVSRTESGRRAGIVTLRRRGVDNGALYRHLLERNVLCAHRAGGIRLSPHFYTPFEAIDRALTLIEDFEGHGPRPLSA